MLFLTILFFKLGFIFLKYQLKGLNLLFTHRSHFTDNLFLGIFYLFVLGISDLLHYCYVVAIIMTHIITTGTFFIFTLVVFKQLAEVNNLLKPGNKRCKTRFRWQVLNSFKTYHVTILHSIFDANQIYGTMLLLYILLTFPLNTYLLSLIISGKYFLPQTKLTLSVQLLYQYWVLLGFHCIGAMYSQRARRPAALLFHWSAQKEFKLLSTVGGIKLANEVLRVTLLNGISYGKICMITFLTFAKFLLSYTEYLMYWYKQV